jgi:hypothetical protein
LNPHAAIAEVLLGLLGPQPKACPVTGHNRVRGVGDRHDIAAFEQAIEGFVDLLGRIRPR